MAKKGKTPKAVGALEKGTEVTLTGTIRSALDGKVKVWVDTIAGPQLVVTTPDKVTPVGTPSGE